MSNKEVMKLKYLSFILLIIGLFLISYGVYHLDDKDTNQINPNLESNDFNNNEEFRDYLWIINSRYYLYLYSDNTFSLYLNDSNHNDNYSLGTYEVYSGNDAITYISEDLSTYGVTREMLLQNIDDYRKQTNDPDILKHFYALSLNHQYVLIDGEKSFWKPTPYYGYYFNNYNSTFVNMNNNDFNNFVRLEKLYDEKFLPEHFVESFPLKQVHYSYD